MDVVSTSFDEEQNTVSVDVEQFDQETSVSWTNVHAASGTARGATRSNSSWWLAFLTAVLQMYGLIWLNYLAGALIVAFIANGIFGIPLWQIVDVNLSVFLVFMGLQAAWNVARLLVDIVSGDGMSAIIHLLLTFMFAFLPFGVIAGYMIYGALGGGPVSGKSFVFDGFITMLAQGYQQLASVIGDFLGIIKEASTVKGVSEMKVDLASFERIATIVGSVATAVLAWLKLKEHYGAAVVGRRTP